MTDAGLNNPNILRFINDIIKPFEQLNQLLLERWAFSPELNDATRMAYNIAYAISHYPEFLNIKRAEIHQENESITLLSDVVDSGKHGGNLTKSQRNNKLFVISAFEFNDEKKFSFLRNEIVIEHITKSSHDFMLTALDAINFWMHKLQFSLSKRELKVLNNKPDFSDEAWLKYNELYCIHMKQTRIALYKRNNEGNLIPTDCECVKFYIY